jgi:hypothetical protein
MTTEQQTETQETPETSAEGTPPLTPATDAEASPQAKISAGLTLLDTETPGETETASEESTEKKGTPQADSRETVDTDLAAKERELQDLRDQVAADELTRQTEMLRRHETAIQRQDQDEVDSGEIEQSEANKRKSDRFTEQTAVKQRRTELDQHATIMAQANLVGRAMVAESLANEFSGVDGVEDLFKDVTLTNTAQMTLKAREINLAHEKGEFDKKRKGTQKTDSNIPSGSGSNVENMTASEKIRAGTRDM